MEQALALTGVGGQSVQLGAQVLARAAVIEGRQVTYLGTYGGTMRGGNTDATVIVADGPVSSPPVVSRVDAVLAMHHQFWEPVIPKLMKDSLVVVNEGIFEGELDREEHRVFEIPATRIAAENGNQLAGSFVLIAAYAKISGLVGLEALIEGMRESIPSYRTQHIEANEVALRAGFEFAPPAENSVWKESA